MVLPPRNLIIIENKMLNRLQQEVISHLSVANEKRFKSIASQSGFKMKTLNSSKNNVDQMNAPPVTHKPIGMTSEEEEFREAALPAQHGSITPRKPNGQRNRAGGCQGQQEGRLLQQS